MRCEDTRTQLAEYLAGTLAPAAEGQMAEHLRSCPACAREVHDLQDTWRLLGAIPAPGPDTTALRARVEAAAAGYEAALAAGGRARPAMRSRLGSLLPWRSLVVQAAFAPAVLLIGVLLGSQMKPAPAPDPQMAGIRQELQDMRQLVTLSLLQQQSASERLKGVNWTGRLDQPGTEIVGALLDTLMHDPNVNVRLASIDALKRFAEQETVRRTAIDALVHQTSPLVQIALIDFMVEVNEHQAAATLRRLAEDPAADETVRTRAEWGLQQLG